MFESILPILAEGVANGVPDSTTVVGGVGIGGVILMIWKLAQSVGSVSQASVVALTTHTQALKDQAEHRDAQRKHWKVEEQLLGQMAGDAEVRAELRSLRRRVNHVENAVPNYVPPEPTDRIDPNDIRDAGVARR